MESAKVGKRGAIIVPARLRKRFGIEEGTLVTAEEREDGILIRPAVIVPVEKYTPERKASFCFRRQRPVRTMKKHEKKSESWALTPIP